MLIWKDYKLIWYYIKAKPSKKSIMERAGKNGEIKRMMSDLEHIGKNLLALLLPF